MIPAELYYDVYLMIVILLALFTITNYKVKNSPFLSQTVNHKCLAVLTFFVFYIGLRPVSVVFADMRQYTDMLAYWNVLKFHFDFVDGLIQHLKVTG